MLTPVLILSYLNAFVWKECLVKAVKGFTMIAFNESDVLASHGQLKPINIVFIHLSPAMLASGLLAAVPLETQDRRHPMCHCD